MITVKVNGKDEKIKEGLNVIGFLRGKNINPAWVTVEHNFEILSPNNISNVLLKDGDTLEVLRFVGGG